MKRHHSPRAASALLRATALALLATLAACNTGKESDDKATAAPAAATAPGTAKAGTGTKRALAVVNPTSWVTVPAKPDALLQNLAIAADAPTRGMWSAAGAWPFIGVHATLLPSGKVLTWGTNPDGSQQNGRYFDVWDPSLGLGANSHQTSFDAARQDSFCTTAAYLTDGRLMITGGNSNGGLGSNFYTTSSNALAASPANLADQRWYATMMTLPDGRPLIVGGMQPYSEGMFNNPDLSVTQGLASMSPEVFENGGWRTLLGAFSREAFGPDFLRASYPRAWVAPDGRVFGVSTEKMWWLNPAGNGSIVTAGNFKTGPNETTRPNVGATNSAVMYAPGKVLVLGGNALHNGFGTSASAQVTAIDINGANPVLTEQRALNFPRHFPNTIVLPDGKVLVTGGETFAANDPARGVFAAEIWDPATGLWQVGPNAGVYRGYHSITALLPNGTVLSVGSGNPGPAQLKGEIYYPPYLFRTVNGAAQLAPRPTMVALSGLSYANGAPLQVDMATNEPITQLVLIGLSSGTHSFNGGQRRIPMVGLSQDGIRLSATVPGNTLTPPGYYQLIALNAAGVPSLGTIIAVGQGVTPPAVPTTPYTPPVLAAAAIAAPVIAAGGTASFTVPAQTGVTYSWNFGDGTPATAFAANPAVTHAYAQPGVYGVTLSARAADGSVSQRSFLQGVSSTATARQPNASSPVAMETRANGASARVWVVNPDNNSVSVIDTANNAMTEIAVGASPRSVAIAGDGRVWVTNKGSSTLSIINPATLAVVQTVVLQPASQPHGLAFVTAGGSAYVVLEARGELLKLDPVSGAQRGALSLGDNVRHVSVSADGVTALVSRFITPPLPGEATAAVNTATAGGEVLVVNTTTMALQRVVTLRHSDKPDNEVQGSGIPNYLAAAVISPDGKSAWVPSKQDNIKRGTLRNQQGLNFQNAVRAISSRIDMAAFTEDYARRVDHDNSGLGSAAAYHPNGVYLFVALETSRQVAVMDPVGGRELFRLDAGRAPQGLQVSANGRTLAVQNFMDRSVSLFDLSPLLTAGELRAPLLATVRTVGTDRLAPPVLLGKQLFYDARDTRLARDGYLSCASCHNDAGHDGRVWDFTGFGEGLRNTPTLKGRAGMGHGFVHWSGNFDEIQDFEGQIRAFAGGTGLMTDAQFNAGTRNQPLGDRKAGISADLDALAAYLGSLTTVDPSPQRNADGSLTAAATAGKLVFDAQNCANCHTAPTYTAANGALRDIGTLKPSSGKRLGGTLTGIDVPTLLGVGATAPYLHDGSAPTLAAAVQAHSGVVLAPADMANLVAYLQQIDVPGAAASAAWSFNEGSGATAADSSGGNRPLALTNVAWVPGKLGQAAQFNGANSSASTSGPVVNTAQSFSVAAWVRLDALTGWRTMVSQTGTVASGFWLQYSEFVGSKFLLSMHDADTNTSVPFRAVGTTTPVVGQWYHVVGVRDKAAGTMKLYVNGRLEGSTAYSGGWAANGSLNVGRGWFGAPNDWFPGALDEVKAYTAVLTDADVAQLYAQGTPAGANSAPTVSLTSPAAGASFAPGSAINLTAAAADRDGTVAKVEFFDGTTLIGSATAAPWSLNWANAASGAHTLTARATDNAGATTTSAPVTVTVTAAGNRPPTVALTAPAQNLSVAQGTAVALAATAADSDGTVARVEFYSGTTLLGTAAAAPFSFNWAAPAAGSYSVTARAIDNAGASTTSASVTVTVTAPVTPPVAGALANGVYRLVAVHSGKVLDVWGGSTADSAAVIQWPWHGGNNQRWQLTALGGGIYTLTAVHSGKLLDMRGCSLLDGGVAQQFPANATPSCQRWRLDVQPDGSYRLTNVNSGKVLDVAGISAADGAAVHQWTWWNGANQRWRLERL